MKLPSARSALLPVLAALVVTTGCGHKPNPPRPAVTGTLTYPNLIVTPGCTAEVQLNDVTATNAPAFTLARAFISPRETAPLPFELHYTAKNILPDHRYVILAKITCGAQLVLITDPNVPVLTQGNPTNVTITLKQVGALR